MTNSEIAMLKKTSTPKPRPAGRPTEMAGGRAVNVYLDAISIAKAEALGGGKISAGIRAALAKA